MINSEKMNRTSNIVEANLCFVKWDEYCEIFIDNYEKIFRINENTLTAYIKKTCYIFLWRSHWDKFTTYSNTGCLNKKNNFSFYFKRNNFWYNPFTPLNSANNAIQESSITFLKYHKVDMIQGMTHKCKIIIFLRSL